ncbi:MAG: hypothetical protein CVU90_12350 [Firmicutes bacterium HGW-Firmicutes-15]|nr:MAG: hypothetical protein CVU90_12350 [Firmicutes bacterium HGW-Firmicutes-15]
MLTKQRRNIINFMVACINEFSSKFGLSTTEAFDYLHKYNGIAFIKDHYEVEHCLGLEDTIEDLVVVCKNNGGLLT